MTAIIGYIDHKDDRSVGVLSSDNLEGWSQCKVDKLIKLSDRFVLGIIGLESVQWCINYAIAYFDQFSGSSEKIKSIKDLEQKITECIPKVFKKWRDVKQFDNIDKQENIYSELVVFDLMDNNLYQADL